MPTIIDSVLTSWAQAPKLYTSAELAPTGNPLVPALGIDLNALVTDVWTSDGWGIPNYPCKAIKFPGENFFRREADNTPIGEKAYAGDTSGLIGSPVPQIVNAVTNPTATYHPALARVLQWNVWSNPAGAAKVVGWSQYVPVRDGGFNYPGTSAPNATTTLRGRFFIASIINSRVGKILRQTDVNGVSLIGPNVGVDNQNLIYTPCDTPIILPAGDWLVGHVMNESCAIWTVAATARQQRVYSGATRGGMGAYLVQYLSTFNQVVDPALAGREQSTQPTVLTFLRCE